MLQVPVTGAGSVHAFEHESLLLVFPSSHCSWLVYQTPVQIIPSQQYDPLAEHNTFTHQAAAIHHQDRRFVVELKVSAQGVHDLQSAVGDVPV